MQQVGTPAYLAPEMLTQDLIESPIDVWGLGCIALELVTLNSLTDRRMMLGVLLCVAVCCRALQCAAVCCIVLQCAAVCCSVLQCVAMLCMHLRSPHDAKSRFPMICVCAYVCGVCVARLKFEFYVTI